MADPTNLHKLHIEAIGLTDMDNGGVVSDVSETQPLRTDAKNDENVVEEDIQNPDEKYTYRPVITMIKNEVTLMNPGSKLQKITVNESLHHSGDNSTDDVEAFEFRSLDYIDTGNERKIFSQVPDEPCEIRVNKNESIQEDNICNIDILPSQKKNWNEISGGDRETENEKEKPEIEVKEREEEVIYNKPISKLPKRVTPKNVEEPKTEVDKNTKEEKCNRVATAHIFIPSNTYEGRPNIFSETPTEHILRRKPLSKFNSKIPKNNKPEDKTYSKIPKLSKSEPHKLTKEPKEKASKVLKEKTSKTEAKEPADKTVKPSKDNKNEKKISKEPKEKSGKTFKEKMLKIITIRNTGRPEVNSDAPISPHGVRNSPIVFKEENNQSEVVHRPLKVIGDKDREAFYPIERNSVIIDQIINSQIPDEIDDIFEELYDSVAPDSLGNEVELTELSLKEPTHENTKIDIISVEKPNEHSIREHNIYLDIGEPSKTVPNDEETTNNDSQSKSTTINQDLLTDQETNINYAIPTTSHAVVKENLNDEIEQNFDEDPTAPTSSNYNHNHLKTNDHSETILKPNPDESINNFLIYGVIGVVCDKGEKFMEKRKQLNPVTEPVLITETETNHDLSENINKRNNEGVSIHTIEQYEKSNIEDKLETSPYVDQLYTSLEPVETATGQEQDIDTDDFENQHVSLQPLEEIEAVNNEKNYPGEYLINYPTCKEDMDIAKKTTSNNTENVQTESTEIIEDVEYDTTSEKVNSDTNISTKDREEPSEYFEAKNNEILKSNNTNLTVNIAEPTPGYLKKEIKSEFGFEKVNVENFNTQESFSEPVETKRSNESSKLEVIIAPEIPENFQYKPNKVLSTDVLLLAEETAINETESNYPTSSEIADTSKVTTEEEIVEYSTEHNNESDREAIDILPDQVSNSGKIAENSANLNTEENACKIIDELKETEMVDDLSKENLSEFKDQFTQIQPKKRNDLKKENENSIKSVKENPSSAINEDILVTEDSATTTEKEFPKNTDEQEIFKDDTDEKALLKDVENEEREDDSVYSPVLTVTKKETVYTSPNNKLQKITVTEKWEDPWRLLTQVPKEEIKTPADEKVNEPTSPAIDLSRPNYRDTVRQKMKEISDRSSLDSNQTEMKRDIKHKENTKPLPDFKSKDIHKPKIVDHLTKKDAKERVNNTFENYIKNNTEIKKENVIDSNESIKEIKSMENKGKVKQMINRIVNKSPEVDVKMYVKAENKSDKSEEVVKGKVQNVLQRFESREELSEIKKTIEEPKPVNKKFQHILNKFENKSNAEGLFEEESRKERKIEHIKTFKNEDDLAKEAIIGKVQNILKDIESKKDRTALAKGKSMENIFSSNLDHRREFVRRKSVFEVGDI